MKLITVHLPKNEAGILVTIAFNHGYFDEEDDMFGIGHLAEHYLVVYLKKKYKTEKIFGEISDAYMNLSFQLNKKAYEIFKQIDITKELIEISKSIDVDIFKNEKKRIEIELEEKYSSMFNEISKSIEHKVILKPSFLIRDKRSQIKNIKKITPNQLSNFIEDLSKKERLVFVGSQTVKSNFEEYENSMFRKKYTVEFSKNKTLLFESKNKILKKAQNFAIALPCLGISTDLIDRIIMSFVIRKIYHEFDKRAQNFGVYTTDYKNLIHHRHGLVWFSANSYSHIDEKIKDVFYEIVDEVVISKKLSKELKKYKRERIKALKKEWGTFYGRLDWVIHDMVHLGRFISLEEYINTINAIDEKKVFELTKNIFQKKKEFVFWGNKK